MDATVVVPTTGRRPAHLARALGSVRAQTWAPRELIVVVDAGADAMAAVVALAGPTVRVVSTGATNGVSRARNLGAAVADTSFVAFLDDDDQWKTTYLQRVFADGDDFDLALTAFEKHGARGAWPEKVPPAELTTAAFLIGNPGIRGSNIVVRKAAYTAIGGFDAAFPSFNDMDLGLRLSLVDGLRYRRVTEHLVEYHAHDGDRLSGPRSLQIAPGIEAYLTRHGARMTPSDEAAFRDRALRFWGVEPWRAAPLRRRLAPSVGVAQATQVAHAAQTRHQQVAGHDDDEAAALWDVARAAARLDPPGLRALRFVVITTDTPGSFVAWLTSLAQALDDAGWTATSGHPSVEVLRIANDADPRIDAAHRAACVDGIAVRTVEIPADQRPLPLPLARPFAFAAVTHAGWRPSADAPVWSIDEDFRFETLVPARALGFVRRSGGPLLHRLAAMARRFAGDGVDAIVGGNTGAAPVPALGTILLQVLDLCGRVAPSGDRARRYADARDPYYDFGDAPAREARMPFAGAWWRSDRQVCRDDISRRLRSGLPVTRPALASPLGEVASAWGDRGQALVAGGNVVLLTPRALDAELFAHASCGDVLSRRADTMWCLRATGRGAKVVRGCLPLLHERALRVRTGAAAAHEARADALGVGLYRSLAAGRCDPDTARLSANQRLAHQRDNLVGAVQILGRAAQVGLEFQHDGLARWLEDALDALVPLTGSVTIHLPGGTR